MYLENYLKPGDNLSFVPIGIPMTLQYNASGNAEKVYVGYDSDREDATDEFMIKLINSQTIAPCITLTKGTTWIQGVLYTGSRIDVCGNLPEAAIPALKELYRKSPDQFNFFAFNVECTSFPFPTYSYKVQYFHLWKFHVLPNWVVPMNMSDDTYRRWLEDPAYMGFSHTIIYYVVSSDSRTELVKTNILQNKVIATYNFIDDYGYYKVEATLDNGNKLYFPYNQAAKQKIGIDSYIISDVSGRVIDVRGTKVYDDIVTCPYCGKRFALTDDDTMCADPHCASRLVTPIQRFIRVLGLPDMDAKDIRTLIDGRELTCVTDIFTLDTYSELKVDTNIAKVLEAMVPVSYISNPAVYKDFAIACTNDIKTALYYIDHPTDISTDLGLQDPNTGKLIDWLSDNCNAIDLKTVLGLPQINLALSSKRFNGAPIFRNKTIYITGDFIHGSTFDIVSILESYSAKVTTTFTCFTDCVLIGGIQTGINGKAIASAKNLGIPIMTEVDFFQRYDIDSDLNNLV